MSKTKYIVDERQILEGVEFALKMNIKETRIVEILMQDIGYEIETILYDDCEEYKAESEDRE